MKWATLICCFLFAIAVDSRHLQKRHHADSLKGIGELKKTVGDENFEYVVLALLGQTLQKCSVDEHLKLVPGIVEVAQHCQEHPEEEKCKKSPMAVFYDKICEHKELETGYAWLAECCAKEGEEEHKCFDEHSHVDVEPYKIASIEGACKQHHDDPKHAFKYFIVEIARRHGELYTPTVIVIAKEYHTVTTDCCAAEEKEKCFGERMPQVKKKTDYAEAKMHQKCHILKRFPERVTDGLALTRLAQRYSKADLQTILPLAREAAHRVKDCCTHDSVECMSDTLHLVEHICEAKAKLSDKLEACCEQQIFGRSACIFGLPIEDHPADLPSLLPEFVENDHVCKDYEADKNGFMAKFTHHFAQHHPHSHPLFILRVAKGYEEYITKCCATENPPDCYKDVPKVLDAAVELRNKIAKDNCEALKTLGSQNFLLRKLAIYTKRMPQVSDDRLIEIASKLTKIASKCCALPEDQIQYCGEEKLDLLLGDMCEKQEKTPINNQVKECCSNSYANRRKCFMEAGLDPHYKVPALDEKDFHIDDDVCKGTPEEQEHHRLELFVDVIKHKPDIGKEELKEIVAHFRTIADKCCADANPKECLATESVSLLAEVKKALGH